MMPAEKNGILVVGAGELGTAVLQSLTSHPSRDDSTPISLLLRKETITSDDPAKRSQADHFCSLGITLVPGDVVSDTHEALASTLRPFDTVIVCTGMWLPPGTQLRIARASLAAGTRRLIPWQFGVDYDAIGAGSAQDLFDEQLVVRALLRSQTETQWTILSTGMFVSFLFEPSFAIVDLVGSVTRALGDWTTEVTVTTVEDIGRMVAEVIWLPDETTTGVVYVAGDTISYGRLAAVVEEVTGREFSRERWSVDFLKEELDRQPDDKLVKYRGVFAAGKGVSWPVEVSLNHRRGLKLASVADYLRQRVRE
ncbi:saccharopine dehydrogenase-like oxidoreductase [Plectosphaerella plurivora]|uniref:Saccharopine dehydrogenase-like oxidoreductase n=1 Tax=Plectosphaerella plurivora TaxID=936078 RepID=A0A9P8V1A1_9PEZI|nr:saccharopine dehydrogenase-like oxidoreductase [Plectosphaerella plurivora]